MAKFLRHENQILSSTELHSFCKVCLPISPFVGCLENVISEEKQSLPKEETQFDTKRGVQNEFWSIPGYITKTISRDEIIFVNICYNDLVTSPKFDITYNNEKLSAWNIPHYVSQSKLYHDKWNKSFIVYDVIFHPTIQEGISDLKHFTTDIAYSLIEKTFNVYLSKENIEFIKVQYKPTLKQFAVESFVEVRNDYPGNYEYKHAKSQKINIHQKLLKTDEVCETTYCYSENKYGIYLQQLDGSNLLCPLSLRSAIKLHLPIMNTVNMDISEKCISLLSELPFQYHLSIMLPFDSQNIENVVHTSLIIPVKVDSFQFLLNSLLISHDDSGIESDIGSPEHVSKFNKKYQSANVALKAVNSFFDKESDYILPSFNISIMKNIVMFTINIKNAIKESLSYVQIKNYLALKCSSVNTGSSLCYAFCIYADTDMSDVQVEIWDNNVTLQFIINQDKPNKKNSSTNNLPCERSSDDNSDLPANNKLEMPSSYCNAIYRPESTKSKSSKHKSNTNDTRIEKFKIYNISESSDDNILLVKHRGILKCRSLSRSISESSGDDHYGFSASLDQVFNNSSVEISSSAFDPSKEYDFGSKKTVRFKEEVSKQVFRSNSSILGQKKKNQRKNRNKKRAHERKLSESENSEGEDKEKSESTKVKCTFIKNPEDMLFAIKQLTLTNDEGINNGVFKSDLIFQIDM